MLSIPQLLTGRSMLISLFSFFWDMLNLRGVEDDMSNGFFKEIAQRVLRNNLNRWKTTCN